MSNPLDTEKTIKSFLRIMQRRGYVVTGLYFASDPGDDTLAMYGHLSMPAAVEAWRSVIATWDAEHAEISKS